MRDARAKVIAVLLLIVVGAALLAGCGGDSKPPPPGTPSAAEFLVNEEVLAEQPKGSPEEALMTWWRSIQYNDFDGYLNELATPLRGQRERDKQARNELALVSGELNRAQPKIVHLQRSGNQATVFTRVESRQPVGATRYTTSSIPQAFTLTRQNGEWKIADDFYVKRRAQTIEEAIAAAKQQ